MNKGVTPRYIIATDVGGTCTDTLIIAEGESALHRQGAFDTTKFR